MDALTIATIALRCIVFPLALWNLWWSRKSAAHLLKGRDEPITVVVATIFWASATAATFQLAFLFSIGGEGSGIGPLWRFAATLVLVISMVLAAASHRVRVIANSHKLQAVYENLDAALAIATLAQIDPAAAKRIADECRQHTADIINARNA